MRGNRKMPCMIDGTPASTTDSKTWERFDVVWQTYNSNSGEFDGLGFVFSEQDPYVGIDLDTVRDPKSGYVDPIAQSIIDSLDSYTEISPSGYGFHIITKADTNLIWHRVPLPDNGIKRIIVNPKTGKQEQKQPEIEMYSMGRYFTITGNSPRIVPVISNRTKQITELQERFKKNNVVAPAENDNPDGPDMTVIGLEHDSKFIELWNGSRPTGDESRDDLSLMNKLAFWCNRNRNLMIDRFFNSPHYDQKDEAHKTKCDRNDYLSRTADKALKETHSTADEENAKWQKQRHEETRKAFEDTMLPNVGSADFSRFLVSAADVPYEPPRWLIEPYIQKGKGTMVQAEPGVGKTAFVCAIAACVSAGKPLLGIPVQDPGHVLMLSVEDDLGILRGRLEANGADLNMCSFLTNASALTFESPSIETVVKAKNVKLIIFDPFQAFLGGDVDMHRANETRPKLAKLFDMCNRNDCACIIIAHTGKGKKDKNPIYHSLGSADIPAAMRSIIGIAKSPDNKEERIAVHVKCSNARKGDSIAYKIVDKGGVEWAGFTEFTAEDLETAEQRNRDNISYDSEPLVKLFKTLIEECPEGGFWSYKDLEKEGQRILGFKPFDGVGMLKTKLSNGLARELQRREDIVVKCGETGPHNSRGIRIEVYLPEGLEILDETS